MKMDLKWFWNSWCDEGIIMELESDMESRRVIDRLGASPEPFHFRKQMALSILGASEWTLGGISTMKASSLPSKWN